MSKLLKFDEEARRGLEAGVDKLADAVKAVSYTHLTLPTILRV